MMSGTKGMKHRPLPDLSNVSDGTMIENKREYRENKRDARFICWDGEGVHNSETGRQDYALLGNSTGAVIRNRSLKTRDMLAFIIRQGKECGKAIHVGFSFDYDVNMILRDLPVSSFQRLKKTNVCYAWQYRIEHIPHKWLTITERGPNYENDERDKFTVRISDLFGFFQCSFLKAINSYIPNDPNMESLSIVEQGKAGRHAFTYDHIDDITEYWTVEIALLESLANKLRELVYDVSLYITQWHGPGSIANYVYKTRGIKQHKCESNGSVHDAAKYAYAGGRFEMFQFGRFEGPVYSIDINSAYPSAIAELPSLQEGHWCYVESPTRLVEFGVYHVRLKMNPFPLRKPGPMFHRDHKHNITFPWWGEGWYWTPETAMMLPMLGHQLEIIEGWEYVEWNTRPFEFVRDMYNERRDLKARSIGSERALKLALNSLYGKMAQRAGWERNNKAPSWHQLEWAGYVTSRTRQKLYVALANIDPDKLIAVETDGIYTTQLPDTIGKQGIWNSKELGGWEVSEYKEMYYIQSGMYFLNDGHDWSSKYRGLDSGTLSPDMAAEFLQSLHPRPWKDTQWPPITGPTTRFVGYRQALMRDAPFRTQHCRWETNEKEITVGKGKRAHTMKDCDGCDANVTPWDMPHQTVINSLSPMEPKSVPHPIPWEDDGSKDAEWRGIQIQDEGMIYDV